MDKFWQLLEESVIVQGVMTLMVWGAIIYLVVAVKPVPDILSAGGMGILGFWFGSKVTAAAQAQARILSK
jgi:hypothetical protein